MNDGLFPSADQPWIPQLIDVERMKASEPDGSPVDWRRFGWSALEVSEEFPHIISRFDILKERFNERYAYRMLNAETMEKWQVRLQNRFDEVAPKYERAYRLYDENSKRMDDVVPGRKTTDSLEGDSSVNTDSTSTSKYSDTPDTLINTSDDYAGSITRNTGKDVSTSKDKQSRTTEEIVSGAEVIQNVNDSINAWIEIDTEFVSSFENNFLNIWWY